MSNNLLFVKHSKMKTLAIFLTKLNLSRVRAIFWKYWVILCNSFCWESPRDFRPWPLSNQNEVKFQRNKNGVTLSTTFYIIYDKLKLFEEHPVAFSWVKSRQFFRYPIWPWYCRSRSIKIIFLDRQYMNSYMYVMIN